MGVCQLSDVITGRDGPGTAKEMIERATSGYSLPGVINGQQSSWRNHGVLARWIGAATIPVKASKTGAVSALGGTWERGT